MHVHVGFCVIADYTEQIADPVARIGLEPAADLTSTIRATMNKMPNLVNVRQYAALSFLLSLPSPLSLPIPHPLLPVKQTTHCNHFILRSHRAAQYRTHRTHLQI